MIEKTLKHRLCELEDKDLAASKEEVQQLLDRLKELRDRTHTRQCKWDIQMAPLRAELGEHRRRVAWARRRLDPENKHTGFSVMDVWETAECVAAIEEKRGRIITSRLLYGSEVPDEVRAEKISVLEAAVRQAKREEAKWRSYLRKQLAKTSGVVK